MGEHARLPLHRNTAAKIFALLTGQEQPDAARGGVIHTGDLGHLSRMQQKNIAFALDRLDRLARQGYFSTDPDEKRYGQDVMWYLWSGAKSPIFGKNKMATFERYFLADKATHAETRNPYYVLRDKEEMARKIMI